MNLLIVLSLAVAVALFPPVLALPANIEPPSKDVDFDVFPESTDLDSLEQLAGNGTPDDTDDDYDIEARSPEAAAAFQCTLANLNKIMFNYNMSDFQTARKAKSPSCFDWSSDACTLGPDRPLDFNFIPSCQRHDFGDTNFRAEGQWNSVNKEKTDGRFRADMLDVCAAHEGLENMAKKALCKVFADQYATAVVVANPATGL